AGFVPGGALPVGMVVAGSAAGTMGTGACLAQGHRLAAEVLADLGFQAPAGGAPTAEDEPSEITPTWSVPGDSRAWVDLQNDVTAKDIRQAEQEGFRSVEHLKRYTTLGMATDQGRTSNVLGLALMAQARGRSISETGTTVFRPPYSPVALGAFAGRARCKDFRPYRLPPSHAWAKEIGASFVESGPWLRAEWYTRPGESTWRESCDREVLATRGAVGVADVSTLGKIDIQGRDATDFLNRVYANGFAKLAVGKVRYGIMLREDGIVMDDGTTARLGETHYVMTTTTANAVGVYRHLDFCRQCLWPDMDVHIISVTDSWAQYAVAGPRSRDLLRRLVDPEADISNGAFPFMACSDVTVCGGVPARLFRISFSGELAYEIAVPSRYGDAMIRAIMAAGKDLGVTPYGMEALSVMRIEKGHPVANELTGQTTAKNLGLGRMVSDKKDSIGAIMSRREYLMRDDTWQLMGIVPVDPTKKLSAGAHFLEFGAKPTLENDLGWMTSVAYSPNLGHHIGLGFVKAGGTRLGERIRAWDGVRYQDTEVKIVSPHFVDPEGERLRG
ncbi:MAG: glycine cleavage T C-terminal barrel domain-containing protein, partial [Pseudomonadota bacterium]